MYCHAMATLALCEAYALTGDERLRDPVERAVGFLVRARASDGLAWRYAPGAPVGDTSILGWVVMALKSARGGRHPDPGDRPGRARSPGSTRSPAARDTGPGPLSAVGAGHPDHDRRGLGLPPVPRRRRPRPGQHRGRRLPARARARPRPVQPLLLVLRHPRHVPARRRRLDPLERPGPRPDRPPPAHPRPPGRELGPRRQPLRRQGRPDLLHGPGHPDPGSLLPLPPPLRRAQAPRRAGDDR